MAEEQTLQDEPQNPMDAFDSAFSQFSAGEDAPNEEEEEVVESETTAEEPVEEEVSPEGQEAAEIPEGTEEGVDGGEEPEGEPEKPTRLSDDELIDRLSSAVAQKAQPPKEETKQPEQQPEPDDPQAFMSEEERNLVSEYQKDWPDVSKAESLIRKSEYQQVVKYVFEQVAAEMRPVIEQVQALAQRTHYSELQSAVGEDYDDVRDKVVEWVDTQPEYLQDAYNRVIQNGTVDEVADLVNRFKQETGTAAPPPTPEKEAELPPAAKKAAKSLAPVSSKRTVVPESEDPGDFESAFSKFAGKFSINA